MQINRISHNFNNQPAKKQQNNNQNFVNFTGDESHVKLKFMDNTFEYFAKLLGKNILSKDYFLNLLESKTIKNGKAVQHLSALVGLIIGGTYVARTLNNDKLDSKKRTTLAINQGIVTVTGTILGYAVTNALKAQIERLKNRFEAVNFVDSKLKLTNPKMYEENVAKLMKYKDGIGAGLEMMVFGLIYRFLSPVIITPIANHIGNKIQEKKDAQLKSESKNANS